MGTTKTLVRYRIWLSRFNTPMYIQVNIPGIEKNCLELSLLENTYDQFVVFAQNHDQIGNRLLGDRLTASLSFEALKLVAATVLLAPQVPLLFMGEEYGEKNPFQYFISHTDEELSKDGSRGKKKGILLFPMARRSSGSAGRENF